ncbi:MAG: hypothetical protein HXS48_20105 [Theionarchaea archaeon]|nr:MAG: hypothetical protein AYK19_00450 [Theionarchaea archaeon DG-70-1]MBU7029251.1 hypothetical protein [Theionarchaea archaeon]
MIRVLVKGIEARRFLKDGEKVPKVGISNNSSIVNIEKKDGELAIDFVFASMYNPSIASIKIDGTLYYQGDDVDDIFDTWTKERTIKRTHVQNIIIEKGLMEAVILAKELNVVPPIPLPRIQEEKKKVEEEFYHG